VGGFCCRKGRRPTWGKKKKKEEVDFIFWMSLEGKRRGKGKRGSVFQKKRKEEGGSPW